eukprot:jgi/Bigna1/140717/aug1.58_g15425
MKLSSFIWLYHHLDLSIAAQMNWAAKRGDIGSVEQCLRAGVPTDAKSTYHGTPLHLAAEGGYVAIIRLLLSYGANPNALDGNTEAISLLVHSGAKIDSIEPGWTPLHGATNNRHLAAVSRLVGLGASLELPTLRNESALEIAKRIRDADIQNLLIQIMDNSPNSSSSTTTTGINAADAGTTTTTTTTTTGIGGKEDKAVGLLIESTPKIEEATPSYTTTTTNDTIADEHPTVVVQHDDYSMEESNKHQNNEYDVVSTDNFEQEIDRVVQKEEEKEEEEEVNEEGKYDAENIDDQDEYIEVNTVQLDEEEAVANDRNEQQLEISNLKERRKEECYSSSSSFPSHSSSLGGKELVEDYDAKQQQQHQNTLIHTKVNLKSKTNIKKNKKSLRRSSVGQLPVSSSSPSPSSSSSSSSSSSTLSSSPSPNATTTTTTTRTSNFTTGGTAAHDDDHVEIACASPTMKAAAKYYTKEEGEEEKEEEGDTQREGGGGGGDIYDEGEDKRSWIQQQQHNDEGEDKRTWIQQQQHNDFRQVANHPCTHQFFCLFYFIYTLEVVGLGGDEEDNRAFVHGTPLYKKYVRRRRRTATSKDDDDDDDDKYEGESYYDLGDIHYDEVVLTGQDNMVLNSKLLMRYWNQWYLQNKTRLLSWETRAPANLTNEEMDRLTKQLEFYFSAQNLYLDVYMLENMDAEGLLTMSPKFFKRINITSLPFGLKFNEGTKVIREVRQGSHADKAGLRPGWVLHAVNDNEVFNFNWEWEYDNAALAHSIDTSRESRCPFSLTFRMPDVGNEFEYERRVDPEEQRPMILNEFIKKYKETSTWEKSDHYDFVRSSYHVIDDNYKRIEMLCNDGKARDNDKDNDNDDDDDDNDEVRVVDMRQYLKDYYHTDVEAINISKRLYGLNDDRGEEEQVVEKLPGISSPPPKEHFLRPTAQYEYVQMEEDGLPTQFSRFESEADKDRWEERQRFIKMMERGHSSSPNLQLNAPMQVGEIVDPEDLELRIDPTDGKPKNQFQFYDKYKGSHEWRSADVHREYEEGRGDRERAAILTNAAVAAAAAAKTAPDSEDDGDHKPGPSIMHASFHGEMCNKIKEKEEKEGTNVGSIAAAINYYDENNNNNVKIAKSAGTAEEEQGLLWMGPGIGEKELLPEHKHLMKQLERKVVISEYPKEAGGDTRLLPTMMVFSQGENHNDDNQENDGYVAAAAASDYYNGRGEVVDRGGRRRDDTGRNDGNEYVRTTMKKEGRCIQREDEQNLKQYSGAGTKKKIPPLPLPTLQRQVAQRQWKDDDDDDWEHHHHGPMLAANKGKQHHQFLTRQDISTTSNKYIKSRQQQGDDDDDDARFFQKLAMHAKQDLTASTAASADNWESLQEGLVNFLGFKPDFFDDINVSLGVKSRRNRSSSSTRQEEEEEGKEEYRYDPVRDGIFSKREFKLYYGCLVEWESALDARELPRKKAKQLAKNLVLEHQRNNLILKTYNKMAKLSGEGNTTDFNNLTEANLFFKKQSLEYNQVALKSFSFLPKSLQKKHMDDVSNFKRGVRKVADLASKNDMSAATRAAIESIYQIRNAQFQNMQTLEKLKHAFTRALHGVSNSLERISKPILDDDDKGTRIGGGGGGEGTKEQASLLLTDTRKILNFEEVRLIAYENQILVDLSSSISSKKSNPNNNNNNDDQDDYVGGGAKIEEDNRKDQDEDVRYQIRLLNLTSGDELAFADCHHFRIYKKKQPSKHQRHHKSHLNLDNNHGGTIIDNKELEFQPEKLQGMMTTMMDKLHSFEPMMKMASKLLGGGIGGRNEDTNATASTSLQRSSSPIVSEQQDHPNSMKSAFESMMGMIGNLSPPRLFQSTQYDDDDDDEKEEEKEEMVQQEKAEYIEGGLGNRDHTTTLDEVLNDTEGYKSQQQQQQQLYGHHHDQEALYRADFPPLTTLEKKETEFPLFATEKKETVEETKTEVYNDYGDLEYEEDVVREKTEFFNENGDKISEQYHEKTKNKNDEQEADNQQRDADVDVNAKYEDFDQDSADHAIIPKKMEEEEELKSAYYDEDGDLLYNEDELYLRNNDDKDTGGSGAIGKDTVYEEQSRTRAASPLHDNNVLKVTTTTNNNYESPWRHDDTAVAKEMNNEFAYEEQEEEEEEKEEEEESVPAREAKDSALRDDADQQFVLAQAEGGFAEEERETQRQTTVDYSSAVVAPMEEEKDDKTSTRKYEHSPLSTKPVDDGKPIPRRDRHRPDDHKLRSTQNDDIRALISEAKFVLKDMDEKYHHLQLTTTSSSPKLLAPAIKAHDLQTEERRPFLSYSSSTTITGAPAGSTSIKKRMASNTNILGRLNDNDDMSAAIVAASKDIGKLDLTMQRKGKGEGEEDIDEDHDDDPRDFVDPRDYQLLSNLLGKIKQNRQILEKLRAETPLPGSNTSS